MKFQPESNRVNPAPCDLDDVIGEFATINQNFINIYENNGADTFKVMVSAADTTPDYLYPSITTHATRNTTADPLIAAAIGSPAGNETLTLFLDSSAITDYNASGLWVLALDGDQVKWYDATTFGGGGGGGDDVLVKVSGADTVSEYLYASMKDSGTYDPDTDILVMAAIADAAANEKLRLFFRLNTDFFDNVFDNLTLFGLTYVDGTLSAGYHLVRGQATSDVSAATSSFDIDNVVPLADGADPGSTITGVLNTQQESFQNNDWVTAIYNADGNEWQVLLVERKRLVRGQVASAVLAAATTVDIDNIVLLAGGVDPRGNPASSSETLTIGKSHIKTALEENAQVTAIWAGSGWELLDIERYRMIRGTVATSFDSGDATFTIDHIVVLESGRDPRNDPTDVNETVVITNTQNTSASEDAIVYAVWNAKDAKWESLPDPVKNLCEILAEALSMTLELSETELTVTLNCHDNPIATDSVAVGGCS